MAKTIPVMIRECVTWATSNSGLKHREGADNVHDKECSACAFERILAHNIRSIVNGKLEGIAVNFEIQSKEIDGAKSPMHEWQKTFVLSMGKAMRTLKELPPIA